ncbi:PH domain-containing protein [Roseomonas sp. JC162]|uniref:PH domain-containing protein n=1 Tax=Neoroseomonas marina TaxID=1232220 RepID=A0A848EAQ8_9PROT|nr:PH domain-containing protein [Neoroseomonas marina]
MREHDNEPVPGLPELLPEGEAILWQGAPAWRGFMLHAFRLPWLALYFGLLAAWHLAEGWGADATLAAFGAARILAFGMVALVVLAVLSRFICRTTLYTITNRRIVMRVGVALPMTVNIPFAAIRSADLRLAGDRSGDILLRLLPGHRVSYVALWPHVRMWRIGQPAPVLRALPDAEAAAQALSRALSASAAMPARALHAASDSPGGAAAPEAAAAA